MIQDFETSVKKLAETGGLPTGDSFVPRLGETLFELSKETVRDLKQNSWHSQFEGGLNAGYVLCLLGNIDQGVEFLAKSIEMYKINRSEYGDPESSVLEFVVNTLEESGAAANVINQYKVELALAKEREAEKPEDLLRKIIHTEADMECAEGDLREILSRGRREQGLLYQRLGEHVKAIEHFKLSMSVDTRDWKRETTISNTLSIIDSLLEGGNQENALARFMTLMSDLGIGEVQMGEKLPELFIDNFETFHPYLGKLGLTGSMDCIAQQALARLKTIESKKDQVGLEVTKLTRILAVYYVSKGDFQKACDIYDTGRAQLEHKFHLSWREQAELAIRAGDPEKAKQLITKDEARESMGFARDEQVFELASLELQLGSVKQALDRLDAHCVDYKRCLVSGSYGEVFEARKSQVDIMKAAIGKDYLQKLRDHLNGQEEFSLGDDIKFLERPLEETEVEETEVEETKHGDGWLDI